LKVKGFSLGCLFVLLVAAVLRLYRLPALPLGLHYDEAANGILAREIAWQGYRPVFIPSYTGKEVLFFYWTALWMRLIGGSTLALRLSAAAVGLITIAVTIWMVRELFYGDQHARWVALLTGAFLATSFWHVLLSRYGFRAVTQPLLQALTVGALWRGWRLAGQTEANTARRKTSWAWIALAGLGCGLTAHTYLAARAFPVPLAAAFLVIAGREQERQRAGQVGWTSNVWAQMALFGGVAALALAPLAHYWLTHPGTFLNRMNQVAAGSWESAWAGIWACLKMFFVAGDPYVRFNLPGRPIFASVGGVPLPAILFALGVLAVLVGHSPIARRLPLASRTFLLVTLPTMLLPSALATGEVTPSNLRAVGLLPFVYVFPALALFELGKWISGCFSRHQRWIRIVILCILCLLPICSLSATAQDYFDDWAPSAALYYESDGDLSDVADYLNRQDLAGATPYVASIHYRHPTLAFLADDYGAIRWLRGGQTLVIPPDGDGLALIPRSASGGKDWIETLLPAGSQIEGTPGPDGTPAFWVYHIKQGIDLAPTQSRSANLAHAAQVIGYDYDVRDTPQGGQTIAIAAWWEVLKRPDRGDYGPVARLVDPWGFVWGEAQPFHYPAEQWTVGERVIDRLTISTPAGAPPGDYVVRFGLYAPSGDTRLPVLDDAGRYAGAYVTFPVRLERPAQPPPPETVDALPIGERLDVRSGGLTLLGTTLNMPMDATCGSLRPGERLYLSLFWQATEDAPSDRDVALSLGDIPLYRGAPVHGTYPTSAWRAGEIVFDRYNPRLPRDAPPGQYTLRLQMGAIKWDIACVTVQAMERAFDIPPMTYPLTSTSGAWVTLGDRVQLLGYDLSSEEATPGERLALTLYWRALTEMDENYTVFVHLRGPDGAMIGQHDGQPVGGTYPTSLWIAGEIVADTHEIDVQPDAPLGPHHWEIGLYIAETGERLPVTSAEDDNDDDADGDDNAIKLR